MAEVRLASTVVIIRDQQQSAGNELQVLMVLRNKKVGFAGGAWVFPGGAIDAEELSAAKDQEEASLVAAVRECEEETGLILSGEDLNLFSHWLAPEESPKRFSTWFYLCQYQGDQAITVDGGEITEYRWARPADLLKEHRAGELSLMPPTYVTLLELSAAVSVSEAQANRAARSTSYFKPRMVLEGERACFMYEEDAGYETKDPQVPGPRHRSYLDDKGCHYLREL